MTDDQRFLTDLAKQLIAQPRHQLFSARAWTDSIPAAPGVYVLWERVSGCPTYVGETADLRSRMRDLGRYRNHTCRRKLAADFGLTGDDELALSARISETHELSFLRVPLGRAELEEYLLVRWGESLINRPGQRHLERYAWVKRTVKDLGCKPSLRQAAV